MPYILTPLHDAVTVRSIATVFFFEFAPNYRSGVDVHPFWEMVYIDRGRAILREEDREFSLEPGYAAFHRPDRTHSIRSDGVQTNGFIISFDTVSPAAEYFDGRICQISREGKETIGRILRAAGDTFDQQKHPLQKLPTAPRGGEQRIKVNLELLLLTLLDDAGTAALSPLTPVADNRLTREIMDYLKNHLYDRVTADDLCEEFHYHKSRLYEIFRENTGTTPLHFYNRLKIEEAKRRILENRETFAQISDALNFDTPLYFSRVFKKYTGVPPSGYRKSVIRYTNFEPRPGEKKKNAK